MVLGVGAAAWPFIYVTLTRLLRVLRGVEEVGPLLASKLLALGLLASGGAVYQLARFGKEFIPDFREGHFVVQVSAVPGTSLREMMRLVITQGTGKNAEVEGHLPAGKTGTTASSGPLPLTAEPLLT